MSPALLLLVLAAELPPSDLTLVGTVQSARPERSVAIVRSGGRSRVVRAGETVFGGRVLAVGPASARLVYGDKTIELSLSAGAARVVEASLPPPARPQPPEDPATPARSLERREVERRLGEEIPRILAETVVIPVTDEGRVAGLAVTRLPESSLLTEAGLRPGDVLTNINGTAIDGLATLIGLWPRLQNERELHAVVLRNGRPVSLTVTLR